MAGPQRLHEPSRASCGRRGLERVSPLLSLRLVRSAHATVRRPATGGAGSESRRGDVRGRPRRRPAHARGAGALIGRLDRRGRLLWSLPKGHVEEGETPATTAVREVSEETGILGRVIGALGVIDFWFVAGGRRVHKTVHHYLLLAEGGELSDADVEVTEVAWVPLAELPERLAYEDERALLTRASALLAETA